MLFFFFFGATQHLMSVMTAATTANLIVCSCFVKIVQPVFCDKVDDSLEYNWLLLYLSFIYFFSCSLLQLLLLLQLPYFMIPLSIFCFVIFFFLTYLAFWLLCVFRRNFYPAVTLRLMRHFFMLKLHVG